MSSLYHEVRRPGVLQDDATLEGLLLSVEVVLTYCVLLGSLIMDVPEADALTHTIMIITLDSVRDIAERLEAIFEERERRRCPHNYMRGRPKLGITEGQILELLDAQFSITDIARLLGCSYKTVSRRIHEFGITQARWTRMSDGDLDILVTQFSDEHPISGQRMLMGYLRACGVRVPRRRARESIMRVDPSGVQSRLRQVLHRRKYSVPGPNSLWHVDGYHKLIRWRIVIHGGIDGFSRLLVYLHASTNNRSDTVLRRFLQAIEVHGLPSRVRSDRGGENVRISQYMLSHPQRGPGRGSMITGRSVHNQRIERLWRDLYNGCIAPFYHLFYELEEASLLDPNNPSDLYALHYIFLPYLNQQLRVFCQIWNHHPLRTEHNKTPQQLWISGLLSGSNDRAAQEGVLHPTSEVSHTMVTAIV